MTSLASALTRQIASFAVLPCLALALALPAGARPLRIQTIDSLPWGYFDEQGKPTGIMYEIANRIAEEAGMPYVNDIIPYARTIVELEYGRYDFVLRYSNDELERVAIPVTAIVSFPSIVLGRADSHFDALGDLHGKTVGVMRGGRFDDAFDGDPFIRKETTNNFEQTMRMVQARRIDAGIGSNVGLYFNAKRAGIKPDELGPPLILSDKPFILHFSKKTADAETVAAVTAAVRRLQRSGEIRRIIHKYVGDFPWEARQAAKPQRRNDTR